MTEETTDLIRGLEQIASTPRQRPQIDIPAIAARGRRKLRVRRAWAVAGSAAAVGLVVTLTATGLPRLGAAPGPPAAPPSPTSAATYPNPLVQRAVFGWLPKGYMPVSFKEDYQNGQHTFDVTAALNGGSRGIIELTDLGAGPEPILGFLSGGKPIKPLPAPPVNGKQAHWATRPSTGYGGRLRWQYGSHRWAEITTHGTADDTATIYRIARSVTFGTARPTAFPFQIRGLPDGLTTYLSWAGPGLGGRSGFSADIDLATGAFSPNNDLAISVTPSGVMAQRLARDPGRKITVDGHRALDRRSTSGGVARHTLIVLGVEGFDIQVEASGRTLQRLQSTGEISGLYHRITMLGTNPSRWTTTPLR